MSVYFHFLAEELRVVGNTVQASNVDADGQSFLAQCSVYRMKSVGSVVLVRLGQL
jgi:hypothetical protein